jgi:uracil-DNA glycosylase family 4
MSQKAEALTKLKQDCIACRKCSIGGCVYEDCPGNVFSNMSMKANILVLGQNPGAVEVKTGKPFVGMSGKNFDTAIRDVLNAGRDEFYISNSIKCFTPGNRAPFPYEIENCRPFLDREIEIVKPVIILAMGNFALFQATGLSGIEKHQGQMIQSLRYKIPVLALYHPSPMNWNKPQRRDAFLKGLEKLRTYLWVLPTEEPPARSRKWRTV